MRRTAIIALLLAVSIQSSGDQRGTPAARESSTVRVGILSKYIRQINENRLARISMRFPPDVCAEDQAGKIQTISQLEIIRGTDGAAVVVPRGTVRIFSTGGPARFRVMIGPESREYPLPLTLRTDGRAITLVVREDVDRYAHHSAAAEYGKIPPVCREAAAALSILIASRCRMHTRTSPHHGFDFCDLTHCQVYRGRLAEPGIAAEPIPWLIDDPRGRGLFFHSRCGGRTLDRVFGTGRSFGGVIDWLMDEGQYLCRGNKQRWERSLSLAELGAMLWGDRISDPLAAAIIGLDYHMRDGRMFIIMGKDRIAVPAETFRLKINRIKGWNFIKSNNYRVQIRERGGQRAIIFRGEGLGHGAGLCQQGARALAMAGYSRYEILEHYFPRLSLIPQGDKTTGSPEPGYVLFTMAGGSPIATSHAAVTRRKLPTGSIFKLIVALYLADRRPDIFAGHRHTCDGRNPDSAIPDRCWDPRGHGAVDLAQALAVSCNLYFASLYRHIDKDDFYRFCADLFSALGIDAHLPPVSSSRAFSRMLAGLDFRIKLSVGDYCRLIRLLAPSAGNDASMQRARVRFAGPIARLHPILLNIPRTGTAAYHAADGSPPLTDELWGKTATIVDGSNRKQGYGLFIGGYRTAGILVYVRNANGAAAARQARALLARMAVNDKP